MVKKNEVAGFSNVNIIINVVVVGLIILLFWCGTSYVSDMVYGEEDYSPERDRSDTQGDWNISDAVLDIRKRQELNLSRMSQMSDYDI